MGIQVKEGELKRVLVTGAAGFVGRALCKRMVDNGWKVHGTTRSSGQAAAIPVGVDSIEIRSISETTDWSKALDNIDTVVHLAARVHVMKDNVSDPLAAFREVNVGGADCLARAAAVAGVRRFIYVSSVKVCGEGKPLPYTEQDAPAPQDHYGVSKWEAEQALSKVAAETGIEVVIIRPPLVYGPYVKANFIRMLKLVRIVLPLPLGAIKNKRSMIYVGNLVDAIVTCLEHPNAAGETFLVSDGEDVSTQKLIRMIASEMNKSSRLVPVPPALLKLIGKVAGKTAEVERLTSSLCVDSSKIRRMLDWKPPFTMEEGIKETVEWFSAER